MSPQDLLWALAILDCRYETERGVFVLPDGREFSSVIEAAQHQKARTRTWEVQATHSLPDLVRTIAKDLQEESRKVKAGNLIKWLKDLRERAADYVRTLDSIVEKPV